MLVLSRKKGEGVVIGRKIRVTVLEVSGNRVKLGFSCPTEVPIHREEVYAEMTAERVGASAALECPVCVCM